MSPARVDGSDRRGWIVPVGGNEEKAGNAAILRRFVELSGGEDAAIAIIPTASNLADTGQRYERLFLEFGARRADAIPWGERSEADDPERLKRLEAASGIFLTGGNQLRLTTILGGTPVAKAIRRRNARGVPVGGTSAGAAILSEHMIAFGEEGATPRAGAATLVPGLGLTNRVVIDQHFRQRDRLGRLLTALAYNPFAIGIGLDEDTAALIDPDDRIHVLGAGAITIVDTAELGYSSIATAHRGEPVCVTGIKLHILTSGASFDLHKRLPTPPPSTPAD